jgi:hypothetical protein
MTYKDYFETVEMYAIDAIDQAKENGNIDEWSDYVHESVDSSSYIIYTYKSKKVLEHTRHEEAYADGCGVEPSDFEGRIPWEKFAYYAMVADVSEKAQQILDERQREEE